MSFAGKSEGLRVYAEVLLAQGKFTLALAQAQPALDVLETSEGTYSEPFQAKLAGETLAKVHEALGDTAEVERYRALVAQLAKKVA